MLSGIELVEIPLTTETESEEYDILIQGSDRQHPAIVIRRKHRGVGGVVRTISKNGEYKQLYADYEATIQAYIERRKARQQRQNDVSLDGVQSLDNIPTQDWADKVLQSVVEGRKRQDEV